VLRGALDALVDADTDGQPDSGYGDCLATLAGNPPDPSLVDPDLPAMAGQGYFYLVGFVKGGESSGFGAAPGGQPRMASSSCP